LLNDGRLLLVLAFGSAQLLLSQSQVSPGPEQSQPLQAGRTVAVRESNEITVPTSGVTAAYSLDPLIAEAQADQGSIRISGRSPGQALIIGVQAEDFSTITIQVTVTRAPPILPETLWSGLGAEDQNPNGYFDLRLSSDPMQVNQALDYRIGNMQVHLTNILAPGSALPGSSAVRFPFSYVRLTEGQWNITLLDENVASSPLSVTSTSLRGAHLSRRGLTFHTGYTSGVGFQSLFLPAYKQLVFGADWIHRLTANSQMGATTYFLQRTPLMSGRRAQALGTLFFKRHTQRSDLFAEVGMSKGIGAAASASHNTDTDQFYFNARYRPKLYASSDTDNLNGLQSEAHWNHIFGPHFVSALTASRNDILTLAGKQAIEVISENLRYKLAKTLSLSSGVSFSHVSDTEDSFANVRRVAVPVGLAYDRTHFGASFQYEYSQTSHAFSPGHAYRASARWSGEHFQMSAAGGLQTESLGVDSVYSSYPGLTIALAQLGVGAYTNIDQLAAFLKDRAFLNAVGIAPNASLELVPSSWQASLNMSWRTGRQVVEIASNYNLQSFLAQRSTTAMQTVRYRRGVGNGNELISSVTLLDTLAPTPRKDVVWELGMRHALGGNPFQHSRERGGDISGTVRLEDASGTRPLEGADILLDGQRRAMSDAEGHYRLADLPPGYHTVQILFRSSRPFWYSTPSRVTSKADSVVDFGIVYPSAQVLGYIFDDCGRPLQGVGVRVKGSRYERDLTTDERGHFLAPVTATGTYEIKINPETVPDGYAVEAVVPATISVDEGESKTVSFTVTAMRALMGLVQKYDVAREEYVPVAGAHIEIPDLHREATTRADGRYLFREMPSGVFTILVDGEQYGHAQLTAAPQTVRYDIRLRAVATIAAAPLQ
jgi:hypothetical protein